ncbi:hypothetical protein SPH72_09695 [Rhodobacterales bacterium FZCC0083]|nr:hypothetical protein SPH72_09695 [Rhodobacterales bacterium FZCC0083]
MVKKSNTEKSQNLKKKVYTSESELKNLRLFIRNIVRDLRSSSYLAYRMSQRDIKAQFRQTFLGLFWILLIPLLNTLVWIALNATLISGENNMSSVYIFVGSLLWSIFADSLVLPLKTIVASRSMLVKLNFPREAIIISCIYTNMFNSIIKIIILLASLVFIVDISTVGLVIWLPAVFNLIVAGSFVGVLLAPVGLLYDDINKALPLIAQFLIYTTSALFTLPRQSAYGTLIQLNPLTWQIDFIRQALLDANLSLINYVIYTSSVLALLLVSSWIILKLAFPAIIERLNN